MHFRAGCVSVLLCVLVSVTEGQNFYDTEQTLRTAVLSGYQYKIRPEQTVTCNVRLSLLNINVLDVPQQSLSVSGWLVVKWNDSRLTWDPATNGGISDFYDTELVLWRPEIIVDNSVSNLGIIESDKLLIRVTSDGELTWEPTGIYETHCDVDVTYYPFDTQTCAIEVTSWGYTVNEVDLQVRDSAIYLADFSPSGEWDVLKTWSERRLLIDGADSHSQLEFHLQLRRRPSYYVMTILIPVIVTSVLCVLVFLLPSESGEKVGYTLTILLTYTVMLTLVASYMPPTSKTTSVLSVYLTIILFVGVFATLETVTGLYFYHHEPDTPIPSVLINVFHAAVLPCIRWNKRRPSSADSSEQNINADRNVARSGIMNGNQVHPDNGKHANKRMSVSGLQNKRGEPDDQLQLEELTWQDLSVAMDKFFFRVMGVFVMVLTVCVLMALIIGGYAM